MKLFAHNSFSLLKATVLDNPYIPHTPTPKQALFLSLPQIEALFGGAAGGGKSDTLLMAALQFVHVPGYAALLLRKSFSDLNKPGALIPRSFAWLANTGAVWNGTNHTWTFYCPGGGTSVLQFGYLDNASDVYQYQSSEFQFIGFDELTQFRQFDYRYMFSRLRKPKDGPLSAVPLRMRSGSNPGGIGHEWVKRRFDVKPGVPTLNAERVFVPSKLADNPHLDAQAYRQSLSHLDPLTRAQLENGDWSAKASGSIFNRAWFRKFVSRPPANLREMVRYWDMAASTPDDYDDPDWTAGCKVGFLEGQWYICHMVRFQKSPLENEQTVASTAHADGQLVRIAMEQEPGASGKSLISHYARNVLPGFDFRGRPALKDKVTRAGPLSSAAENGNVIIVEGDWVEAFLDEVECFPNVNHDDQVDATTGGMAELSEFATGSGDPNGETDDDPYVSEKYASTHGARDAGLGV